MTTEHTIEQVAVGDLIVHPANPRQGDIGTIVQSIEKNGWYGTIVAQRSTGYVLAGNHRLMAAQSLQLDTVPVYWVDVDDSTARRILLADNRAADVAAYDNDRLSDLLTSMMVETGDLLGTGYTEDDLDDLLVLLDENRGAADWASPSRETDHSSASAGAGEGIDEFRTWDESLDIYKDRTSRYMNLAYPIEDFEEITQKLADLRRHLDVESNAEVVIALVRDAAARHG